MVIWAMVEMTVMEEAWVIMIENMKYEQQLIADNLTRHICSCKFTRHEHNGK